MDTNQRIENFRKMAEDDPSNELGHFSLGKALLEAERAEEAIGSLQRVLEINSGFSKAYQLLGEAQARIGQPEQAVETFTSGFKVAAERGDVMPRDAMARLLKEHGAEVPEVAQKAIELPPAGEGMVNCSRCQRPGPSLATPPFKSELGQRIVEHTCGPCWQEWFAMGTKVINELHLDFSNPAANDAYDQHMIEFLNLPPA